MANIELSSVFKAYGDHAPVIRDVNLQIAQGDLSVLFKSWISTVLIVLSIAAVVVPMILRARGRNLSQFATDTD